MVRIQRWSVMIYDSLQTELMETKYNGDIHKYRTPIFGKTEPTSIQFTDTYMCHQVPLCKLCCRAY